MEILKLLSPFLFTPLVAFADTSPIHGGLLVRIMGGDRMNLVSQSGFEQPVAYSGLGSMVDSTTLETPSPDWINEDFASDYYLQLESGHWSAILSNTSQRLILERPLPVSEDVAFRILPWQTLGGLFGEQNAAGFTEGSSIAEADILLPWDAHNQQYRGYYYFNSARQQWEDLYGNSAGQTILFPEDALIVLGRQTTDILLSGSVRSSDAQGRISGGGETSVLANPYPFDIPFVDCGLENSLEGGSSFAEADWVLSWDPVDQSYSGLYYFNLAEQQWKDLANMPVNEDINLLAGTALIVIKNSPTDAEWILQSPY